MLLADQVTLFGHRLAARLPNPALLSGVEGPLPCDVHEVMGAGAAQSGQVGPRLFASGYFLTTTGRQFLTSGQSERQARPQPQPRPPPRHAGRRRQGPLSTSIIGSTVDSTARSASRNRIT
jgi:hypothetical protein